MGTRGKFFHTPSRISFDLSGVINKSQHTHTHANTYAHTHTALYFPAFNYFPIFFLHSVFFFPLLPVYHSLLPMNHLFPFHHCWDLKQIGPYLVVILIIFHTPSGYFLPFAGMILMCETGQKKWKDENRTFNFIAVSWPPSHSLHFSRHLSRLQQPN